MENLYYVTSNPGKGKLVQEKMAKAGLDIGYITMDIEELEINDIDKISENKTFQAYQKIGKPCFSIDSGFYIDAYPGKVGYPGAFAKRSGVTSNIEGLLKTMEGITNRRCCFKDCLTFYDGINFYKFYGLSEGTLATEIRGNENIKAPSNMWKLFIPKNHNQTLAEMTDEERNNRHDGHTSPTIEFIIWYKNEYKSNILKRDVR